jgi:hypothetical protein
MAACGVGPGVQKLLKTVNLAVDQRVKQIRPEEQPKFNFIRGAVIEANGHCQRSTYLSIHAWVDYLRLLAHLI